MLHSENSFGESMSEQNDFFLCRTSVLVWNVPRKSMSRSECAKQRTNENRGRPCSRPLWEILNQVDR